MPPIRWLQLTVRLPEVGDPASRDLIPSLLVELGGSGVEEVGGDLVTYLPPPEDVEGFLAEARQFLLERSGSPTVELVWRWQPHEEWEVLWRRGLGPRRVTDRITVTPSWESPAPSPGEILLTLDPGMAFGTAEHATTRGCLRLMDHRVVDGARIVDVGAGSGILSIAAALLGAREVLALEMDPLACEVAVENISANGVAGTVRVVREVVGNEGAIRGHPYDGLVANLQSGLLIPLFSTFRESLSREGWLIVSGVLQEEREEVLAAGMEGGFSLEEEDREEGWWSGAFKPARSFRRELPDRPAPLPG
jgi:ribosomal protein L11 methyltransferase